ncbi:helix-turn-helix domain-containing protein [Streptomyces sp. NPDC101132]|uniref:helix-turn-helix domain-containing protein n=1 Tax=Streptomyces sp. NPDC101132 TaxID=3366110 RepID=UPI0038007A53
MSGSVLQYAACPEGTWDVAAALPHPALRPGVRLYRGVRFGTGQPRRRLEIPVPWVSLVLGFGSPLRLVGDARRPGADPSGVRLVSAVAGLQTGPVVGEHDGRVAAVEVLLAPWTAYRLFGVPLHALADRHLPAAELLGARADRLAEALAEQYDWTSRFMLVDRALTRWLTTGPVPEPRVAWAWRQLARSGGRLPVAELAARTGWSVRQLENRLKEQAGLTPKSIGRMFRLGRALRLLADGSSTAVAAAESGYCDQSHLHLDFRRMTGATPREFFAARAAGGSLPPAGPPVSDRGTGTVTSAPAPDLAAGRPRGRRRPA